MNRLDLALLGPPEVRLNGHPLTFSTRKALALLLYLAVEGGRQPREKITDLYWPESDAEHGRAALRRTLVLLRQGLPQAGDYLIAEREYLGLNPTSDFTLDLRVLDAALRAGPQPGAFPQLQAAALAYRGDFLTGFSLSDAPAFDDWASLQREYWHRQMESVFDWLSQLHAEAGETGPAIDAAARWVAHSPLNEAAHRRLMMCFFVAGNRTSALQAYEACRVLLHDELGVPPSPETEALADRIRADVMGRGGEGVRGRTGARERGSRGAVSAGFTPALGHEVTSLPLSPSPLLPGTPPPPLPASPAPLVGRAAEFGRLVEAYRAAAQGHPRVITLEGEAGIGKTRLASEFLAWAGAQGARALQGRAFETGGRVPYQPIVEALRRTGLQFPAGFSSTWQAELVPLLPELRDILPDWKPVTSGDDETARTRLLEAIASLTQAIAATAPPATAPPATAPLVVFVDDAQWADAASLDALRYAVRRWGERSTPALLLLTLRPEPAALLDAWLADVDREQGLTRLTLNPLTVADTLRWVQTLAGTEGEPGAAAAEDAARLRVADFGQWLFAETGGQPFFISETLKTLAERGLLVARPVLNGGWAFALTADGREADLRAAARLPRGVQALIRTRLARLTPPALALLTAGAVLGHDFRFEDACAVAGLKEDEALAALDELRQSRLLAEGGRDDGAPSLAITHDKIRDVVYVEAGEARQRVFHRRAMETLQTSSGQMAAELAYHALAAGLAEPAFRFSLAAGDDALRVFAVRNAVRYYEQACALVTSLQPPVTQLLPLYLHLGRAYELEADFDSARGVYQALLAAARQDRQPEAECVALNRLAMLAAQAEMDYGTALAYLHEALPIAEQSGDTASLAETEWNLAQTGYYMGDVASLPHGERALSLARTLGEPELLARSLNTLAWEKSSFMGEWSEAASYAEEGRALFASLGNRAMEADCLCALVNVQLYLGHPREAMETARAAQAINATIENPWGQAHSAFQVAKCALDCGDMAEALEQSKRAADLAQAHKMPFLSLVCLNLLGTIERMLGMLDAARQTCRETRELADASAVAQSQDVMALVTLDLVANEASAGEWQSAYAHLQPLRQMALDRPMPYTMLLTLPLLTEAIVRAGHTDDAAAFVHDLGEHVYGSPRSRVSYLQALAVLERWRGEVEQAEAHLCEAAALAEDSGLLGELRQIHAAQGEFHR
jgi:DNA-binding SARP family transcriptional activator/tetratricopeptide (TPR) repeat protein